MDRSRVTQVWLHDRKSSTFAKVLHEVHGCRWPMWKPDESGFWYVGEHGKGSNLCEYDFKSKYTKALSNFKSDSVVFPCVARDGSMIVFRHLFGDVPATKQNHLVMHGIMTHSTARDGGWGMHGLQICPQAPLHVK